LHLDRNFQIANLARRERRRQDVEDNFRQIVDYVLQNKPDLFLLAGDIFDRVNPGNAAREMLVRKIREVSEAGVKVYAIGGNHDVPKLRVGPSSLAIDVLEAAGLGRVFSQSDRFQSNTFKVNAETVTVAGRSFFAEREETNPFEGQKISLEGRYNLVLLHGSFQGMNVAPSDKAFIRQNPFYAENVPAEVDYLALGHYHNAFDRLRDRTSIVNPGSIERLSWAEQNDPKGFVWAEISHEGVNLERIELPVRPMKPLDIFLQRTESEDLTDLVLSRLEAEADNTAICTLSLQGFISQEQHRTLRIRDIYREANEHFFHFSLDQRDLEVEGFGRVFLSRVDSPHQAYEKRMDRLISDNPEQAEFFRRVRETGLKYLGGGS